MKIKLNKSENVDDTELFYSIKKGDKSSEIAFSVLYRRYSSRIYAYCLRFLGDKDKAQDVFQDTFIRFYNSAKQERVMTNVPAFLLRIARNLCVNAKKAEKRTISIEDISDFAVEDDYDNVELLGLIQKALEQLPDEYKDIFILREYDGLSYNEIAELTDESLSNVKVRLHRAKQKIREILAPYLAELSK